MPTRCPPLASCGHVWNLRGEPRSSEAPKFADEFSGIEGATVVSLAMSQEFNHPIQGQVNGPTKVPSLVT